MAEPLTLRYNNPGAIEYKPFLDKYGAKLGPNGRYAQFPDRESGFKAMEGLLGTYQDKHGLNTVSGIVNRWAPPNVDNNSTSQYTQFVAQRLGVDPTAPIDRARIPDLAAAMAHYEAGRPVPRTGGVPVPSAPAGAPPAMAAGIPTPAPFSGIGPSEVDQRRKMAMALMGQGMDASPVGHWTQGLARVLQGGLGGYYQGSANRAEQEGQAAANQQMTQALSGGNLESAVGGMLSNPYSADTGRQLATGIIAQRIKGPEKTTTQKDYEYAKSQGFTGSLMDFTKAQNESKRPTTNIDMKGETAEAAALGKGSGEAAVDMYKKANASQQQLRSLSQMQANLERVRSGRTAGIVRDVAAWAKDLGVPADVLERMGIPKTFVGDAQAFDALSSRALVNMIGAGGFPANNFSNADRAFLEQTIAQLPKDPRGNRIIIETAKRAAQADVEKAQAFAAWKTQPENKGKSFFDFDTAYAASVSDRFTDLVQESRKLLESAGDGYTTPQTQAQSAGQLAQPNVNQNPAAIIGNVRQQLQSGQIQVPQIVEQARRAIQEGKDPAGIKQRLQDFGIDPASVGL